MSSSYLSNKEGEPLLDHWETKCGITQEMLRIKGKWHTYEKGRYANGGDFTSFAKKDLRVKMMNHIGTQNPPERLSKI